MERWWRIIPPAGMHPEFFIILIIPRPRWLAGMMGRGSLWTLSGANSLSHPDERGGSLLSALAFSLPPSCLLGLHLSFKIILPVLGGHFRGSPVFLETISLLETTIFLGVSPSGVSRGPLSCHQYEGPHCSPYRGLLERSSLLSWACSSYDIFLPKMFRAPTVVAKLLTGEIG